jgi:hypothetical protein
LLFTLKTEQRLGVFGATKLKRIFRSKRKEITGGWGKKYERRSLIIFTLHEILESRKYATNI